MNIADTIYNNIEKLGAQIQSVIAKFLECKLKLLNAKSKATDVIILTKINDLLARQAKYEADLPNVLDVIERGKTSLSAISLSEMADAGIFYYNVIEHISDVNSINSSVNKSIGEASILSNLWTKYKYWIIISGLWLWKR